MSWGSLECRIFLKHIFFMIDLLLICFKYHKTYSNYSYLSQQIFFSPNLNDRIFFLSARFDAFYFHKSYF